MTIEDNNTALILCDRGTLDGLAYWPGEPEEYYRETGVDRAEELARYAAVIQLRPPPREHGYQQTSLRPESAEQALDIDRRISEAWSGHPRLIVVESDQNFLAKLESAVAVIRAELPPCCALRRSAPIALSHPRSAVPA